MVSAQGFRHYLCQSGTEPTSEWKLLPQGGDMRGEEDSANASAERLVRDALSRANAALPPAQAPARTPRCARDPELAERNYEVSVQGRVAVG